MLAEKKIITYDQEIAISLITSCQVLLILI